MKAVLFDFNGTLYNDTKFHHDAWYNYMLRRFGIRLGEEELMTRFLGWNNDVIFKEYFHGGMSDREIEICAREKEAEYRRVAREKPENLKLMDGAPELFEKLRKMGVPFNLATASPIENVEFYLSDLGLGEWFSLDKIVYDQGILPSKPDPAFYLKAAENIGVDPRDCLVAEDTPTGIRAAINAGVGRIVALDRSTKRETLQSIPELYAIVHDFYGFERFLTE